MLSSKGGLTPPATAARDPRAKSQSPIRDFDPKGSDHMSSYFNQLMKKDKEIESLRAETVRLNDQIKEFEFLIVKASEEVKKKQQELADARALMENHKSNTVDLSRVSDLQSQLIEAKTQLKTFENQSNQALIQARVDLQKEKELSNSLTAKLQEARAEIERVREENRALEDGNSRQYDNLAQRYAKVEQENENALKIIHELKQANDYKNQTIDNAHQIIKKLKDESSEVASELEKAQEKVKEYKNKSRTLKKNNQEALEKIKDLERRMEDGTALKNELERAKHDLTSLFNLRREEKEKLSEENKELKTQNESLTQTLAHLREDFARYETQNSFLTTQIEDEKNKTREICTQLIAREEEVSQLQEKLKEEEKKAREEIEGFKNTALKSLNIVSPNNRKPSPFHSVIRVTSDIRNDSNPRDRDTIGSTKSTHSRGFFRSTTPIKAFNKNSTDPIHIRENFEPLGDFASNDKPTLASDGFHTSGRKSKTLSDKKGSTQTTNLNDQKLSSIVLADEIQKAIDREELISLAVEANIAKAEADLANYNVPKIDEKDLIERFPSLELMKKYNQLETKYNESLDIISEMKTNAKSYVEKIETLMHELEISRKIVEDFQRNVRRESSRTEQITSSLLTESKNLFKTYETVGSQSIRGLSERARRINEDLERVTNELRMVEEVIDKNNSQSFTLDDSKYGNLNNSANKKSVLRKINSLIKNFSHKCQELEDEKNRLFEKLTRAEREAQNLKTLSQRMEQDYYDSIREKDDLILKKDELIRNRDEIISQRERQYTQNYEKLNELTTKESRVISVLNDKEDMIRLLSLERESLIQNVDNLELLCADLRKELSEKDIEISNRIKQMTDKAREQQEKSRDIVSKHERIAELQKEVMSKAEEIDHLEGILDKKDRSILEKDKKIANLLEENGDLRREVVDLQTQLSKRIEPIITFESTRNHRSPVKAHTVDLYMSRSRTEEGINPAKTLLAHVEPDSDPGLKKEIEALRSENKELLKKLGWLNDNIGNINNSERDRAQGSQAKQNFRSRQTEDSVLKTSGEFPSREEMEYSREDVYRKEHEPSRMSMNQPKKMTETANLFDNQFVDHSMNVENEKDLLNRNSSKQLKENMHVNFKEDPSFIEQYKTKTKKIFQKRVKELELVLRYVDLKIKGFNFGKGNFISPSVGARPNAEDSAVLTRIYYLIESLLDKNSNLKNFINEITQNIERMYLRQYNMTITLTKLFKSLFVNSIDTENYSTLNQFGLLSELEVLFELNIPHNAESFDMIELLNQASLKDPRQNFFSVFERIEPKLTFLQEYLISTMKQTNEMKLKYQTFRSQAKDLIKAKKEKIYDIETLYAKLRHVADKTKPQSVSIDHFKNFTQTFHNLYSATLQEWQETVSFVQYSTNSSPDKANTSGLPKHGSTVLYGRPRDTSQGHATITPWMNDQSKTSSSIQDHSYLQRESRDESAVIGKRQKSKDRANSRSQDKQKQMHEIIFQIEALDHSQSNQKRSTSVENDKASNKKTAKKHFY